MKSVVWVLGPSVPAARVEEIVAGLAEREVAAAAKEVGGAPAIVVDDPPDDLEPPAEVVRTTPVETLSDAALTRRTFIDAFAGVLALAATGAGGVVAGMFANPPEGRSDEVSEVEAGSLAALKAAGSLRFRFGREPAILILQGDQIFALSLVCTHLGCLVEWRSHEHRLVCPCHRAAFNLEGGVMAGPPPRPLTTFQTVVTGDRIVVRRKLAV